MVGVTDCLMLYSPATLPSGLSLARAANTDMQWLHDCRMCAGGGSRTGRGVLRCAPFCYSGTGIKTRGTFGFINRLSRLAIVGFW